MPRWVNVVVSGDRLSLWDWEGSFVPSSLFVWYVMLGRSTFQVFDLKVPRWVNVVVSRDRFVSLGLGGLVHDFIFVCLTCHVRKINISSFWIASMSECCCVERYCNIPSLPLTDIVCFGLLCIAVSLIVLKCVYWREVFTPLWGIICSPL